MLALQILQFAFNTSTVLDLFWSPDETFDTIRPI